MICLIYIVLEYVGRSTLELFKPHITEDTMEKPTEMRATPASKPASDVEELSDDSHTIASGCSLSDPEWCNVNIVPQDAQGSSTAGEDSNDYSDEETNKTDDDEDVPNTMVPNSQAAPATQPAQATGDTTVVPRSAPSVTPQPTTGAPTT